jgi:hypothetical protein
MCTLYIFCWLQRRRLVRVSDTEYEQNWHAQIVTEVAQKAISDGSKTLPTSPVVMTSSIADFCAPQSHSFSLTDLPPELV